MVSRGGRFHAKEGAFRFPLHSNNREMAIATKDGCEGEAGWMTTWLCLLFGFGLVFASVGFAQAKPDMEASRVAIQSVLRSAVDERKVPCVVAMVVEDGQTVYSGAFGIQDEATNAPVSLDSIFRIASMTKPVTAVAVMQLVEAGKIGLDQPAGRYLPAIAESRVLDHVDAKTGNAVFRPPKTPVTIRQLLSHTSGFAYPRWDSELYEYRNRILEAGISPTDFKEPLMFDPGARWEYGTSTTWLGRIVEAVTGETLEQYFREHILDPLGMKDTSFLVPPEKVVRLVTLHQREEDGSLRAVEKQPIQPKFFDGGGGLSSTAGDYAMFMEMLLGGGELGGVRILKSETVHEMEVNQIGGLSLRPFKTTDPTQSAGGSVPGGLDKFGLGFAISSKGEPGGRAPGSIAWAGLDNTFFWIDPNNGVAAVILMQIFPFLDPAPIRVLQDFEHAVYASPRKQTVR